MVCDVDDLLYRGGRSKGAPENQPGAIANANKYDNQKAFKINPSLLMLPG